MTDERRYGEDEAAEIFGAAAGMPGAGGLSLRELQAIGGEVGIAPERIAAAAAVLDVRRGAPPRGTQLGLPVSVGRMVDLPRAPTDHEWELLVAELRATFGAHGKDRSQGGIRAWTNGNLHAYMEPADGGYRLRLGTVKGNGIALGRLGTAALLTGLVLLALLMGGAVEEAGVGALLAVTGTAALAANAIRLPRWAREREEQMEHVAARALALLQAPPSGTGDGT
jgi:hypothetical protein